MADKEFSTNPPRTEVLSVSEPKELTPEEVSELGEEKKEVPEPEPETIKPETEEVESEPEELESKPEPEITHDPLKDTKAELTRTQQEVAKLKKVLNAQVAKERFQEPPTAQEMFRLPARPVMPKPEEGVDDGIIYAQKVAQTLEAQKTYDDIVSDYESFVAEHPDWLDMQGTMHRISRRYPELMYGRRAMHKIYDLAVKEEKITAIEQARADELAEAQSTGAKIERDKVKSLKAFVKPSGGGATGSKPKIPDFSNMEYPEIAKWIKDNRERAIQLGLIKDE